MEIHLELIIAPAAKDLRRLLRVAHHRPYLVTSLGGRRDCRRSACDDVNGQQRCLMRCRHTCTHLKQLGCEYLANAACSSHNCHMVAGRL